MIEKEIHMEEEVKTKTWQRAATFFTYEEASKKKEQMLKQDSDQLVKIRRHPSAKGGPGTAPKAAGEIFAVVFWKEKKAAKPKKSTRKKKK